jgi:hypothetical protein
VDIVEDGGSMDEEITLHCRGFGESCPTSEASRLNSAKILGSLLAQPKIANAMIKARILLDVFIADLESAW